MLSPSVQTFSIYRNMCIEVVLEFGLCFGQNGILNMLIRLFGIRIHTENDINNILTYGSILIIFVYMHVFLAMAYDFAAYHLNICLS